MIHVNDVSKSYTGAGGPMTVVSHFTLELSPGEFVAVEGPSGCGKSTLMLIAGGLLKPDSGRVLMDGGDLYAMDDRKRTSFRANTIGFVFQEFYLVPYLTVLENIMAGSLAVNNKYDVETRAWELVNRFRIDHRVRSLPEKLSTGEKQRTALCRALINRPRALLADEPTGNLDAENAGVLCDYFEGFVKEGGAVLMVTHDRSVAARASRRLRMNNGANTGTAN